MQAHLKLQVGSLGARAAPGRKTCGRPVTRECSYQGYLFQCIREVLVLRYPLFIDPPSLTHALV